MIPFIVVSVLAVIYVLLSYYLSGTVLYPDRQKPGKSPRDYGMEYRDISFKSTDGLELKGWLIPAKSNRIIVMTHPGSFNRCGLRSKESSMRGVIDVDFLKVARQLRKNGYSVMTFDFRNHGESQGSSNGGITGVGLNEYRDVVGAVNYIRKTPGLKNKKIGFLSFCQGANSTIIAMSKSGREMKDVKCLVAVQPVTVEVFVRRYARDIMTPFSRILIPGINLFCRLRGGYPLKSMSPLEYARDVRVPTLFVQARNDPWTEMSDVESIYNNVSGPKEFLWLDLDRRFDTYNYFGEKPEKLLAFLKKHLK